MEERDDILTLTDDDGKETDFMVIDGVEYNEKLYLMLIEADQTEDENAEAIILRVDEGEEEDLLSSVDDEDEFNAVAALFDANAEIPDENEGEEN